jgi:hypothetical protein
MADLWYDYLNDGVEGASRRRDALPKIKSLLLQAALEPRFPNLQIWQQSVFNREKTHISRTFPDILPGSPTVRTSRSVGNSFIRAGSSNEGSVRRFGQADQELRGRQR